MKNLNNINENITVYIKAAVPTSVLDDCNGEIGERIYEEITNGLVNVETLYLPQFISSDIWREYLDYIKIWIKTDATLKENENTSPLSFEEWKSKFLSDETNPELNVIKVRPLAASIIDKVEDILSEYNIKIPDSDRCGSEDESCIYGTTYYELEDKISECIYKCLNDLLLMAQKDTKITIDKDNY